MAIEVIREIVPLRSTLDNQREQSKRIALVATMGNLHEGHLQLIRLARQHADVVVASIFVNPLQFGLNEDWDQYPRTFESDVSKLDAENCDYLFFPTDREMYPNGMEGQTRVFCPTMKDVLCGASRPGHFEGVTTVVTKLLHITDPDVAIFGEKDFQQLAIIKRMAADLCMRVDIIGAPIARDVDGLALSSRNSFIEAGERPYANQLNKSLNWAVAELNKGRRDFSIIENAAIQQIESVGFKIDYFQICSKYDLEAAKKTDKDLVVLGAMYTRGARLIDNVQLSCSLKAPRIL